MGKNKTNQTLSSEISKHDKNKQMNSVIKALRPKVYITDCLSFKRLVQELTGNGNSSVSSPSDQYMIPDIPGGASAASGGMAFPFHSQETCRQETYMTPELISQKYMGESFSCFDPDSTVVSCGIEEWLLDVNNPCSFYDNHHASFEQLLFLFDNEFPGL